MILRVLSVAALWLISSAAAPAVVMINIATNPISGPFFTSSYLGAPVPDGSLVRVGTFTSLPLSASGAAELESLFVPFTNTTVGHAAPAGANKGMINRQSLTDAPGGQSQSYFLGKQVFIWVYDAPAAAAAKSFGVFSSTNWYFPDSTDDLPVQLATLHINQAFGISPGGQLAGIVTSGGVGSPNQYYLTPIPEPSIAGCAALAGSLAVSRRRRRLLNITRGPSVSS